MIKLIKSFKFPWHPLHKEMMLQCFMCLLQILVYWRSQIFISFCSYPIWCMILKQVSALTVCFYWSFFNQSTFSSLAQSYLSMQEYKESINKINEGFLTRPFRNKVCCEICIYKYLSHKQTLGYFSNSAKIRHWIYQLLSKAQYHVHLMGNNFHTI